MEFLPRAVYHPGKCGDSHFVLMFVVGALGDLLGLGERRRPFGSCLSVGRHQIELLGRISADDDGETSIGLQIGQIGRFFATTAPYFIEKLGPPRSDLSDGRELDYKKKTLTQEKRQAKISSNGDSDIYT